jgi:hypothetical protein
MQLRLLRLTLVTGVLAFGVVVWFLRRSGSAPAPSASPEALLLAGRIAWGVALAGCLLLFFRMRQASSSGQQRVYSIIAWALGEATALYGGVVFLLTGHALWYQLGVGFMVLTLLAFPAVPPR